MFKGFLSFFQAFLKGSKVRERYGLQKQACFFFHAVFTKKGKLGIPRRRKVGKARDPKKVGKDRDPNHPPRSEGQGKIGGPIKQK